MCFYTASRGVKTGTYLAISWTPDPAAKQH
jgi:hypothetical protein